MIVIPAEEVRDVRALAAATEMTVVVGAGELRGTAAAALLAADYAVLRDGAVLHLDSAEAWAGAAIRIGRGALRLHIDGRTIFDAEEALAAGLADAKDFDLGNRSPLALDAAAVLLRSRGGDALERATFAWLFATGEPREGLDAFLGKRKPEFSGRNGPLIPNG